jgi:hypothetical protein
MSEAQRLRDSAAMVQRLAEQQTTVALRNHLLKTARDWRLMAQGAEAAEKRAQYRERASAAASISPSPA